MLWLTIVCCILCVVSLAVAVVALTLKSKSSNALDKHMLPYVGKDGSVKSSGILIPPDDPHSLHLESLWAWGKLTAFEGLEVSGLVYPETDGTDGQCLTTDGQGHLSWKDC